MAGGTPQPAARQRLGPGRALRRLWAGEAPLAEAFWTWGVVSGTLLNAGTTLLAFALLALAAPDAAAAAVFALPLPYNLLVVVAVWRSAARFEGRALWADLARILILVWAVLASVL
jgi:hypothetical protein